MLARYCEPYARTPIRLVILANPNQPTGTLMDDTDVEAIIAECAKAGTIVVIDEAYYLFTPKTALHCVTRYPNLIVVRTFSKAFGLAGLRLGYCVSQAEQHQRIVAAPARSRIQTVSRSSVASTRSTTWTGSGRELSTTLKGGTSSIVS